MRLDNDFNPLYLAVRKMGAERLQIQPMINVAAKPRDPIDIELPKGIEIDIEEIETKGNLLSYKERHILVYIQDHGWSADEVISGLRDGNKYHVAWCTTLEQMRRIGRYDRYVVTNDRSGTFNITGTDIWKNPISGRAHLNVCKNCLAKLDYKGFRGNRTAVFERFDLEEFFETYESHFQQVPTRMSGENDGHYTDDWGTVANYVKERFNFTCQSCRVSLQNHRGLLHVHHENGVKTDNRSSNLTVLCVLCHKASPNHSHVRVSANARRRIEKLRLAQGIRTLRP